MQTHPSLRLGGPTALYRLAKSSVPYKIIETNKTQLKKEVNERARTSETAEEKVKGKWISFPVSS